MSILDVFRKKPLPPGDIQTQKAGLRLINKNADAPTRYSAADALTEIGTEEAIFCLLQRFTVDIGTHIPDEDEKNYVKRKIIQFGLSSIDPLMKFLKEKEQAAQAILILRELTTPDVFLEKLLELVDSFDPYFSKYPDKKLLTFKLIKEFRDGRIIDALSPFLDDDDDDIRIAVLEAIAAQQDEERSRELFLEMMLGSEERPRVILALCDIFAEFGWRVTGYRKQIENIIPDRYYLDSKGHILRKKTSDLTI